MFTERMSVGLDVHARSVVAAALDDQTGELSTARVGPAVGDIVAWLGRLPGPVAVAYEAGPTGFGLARTLRGAGIRCEVVAPSKVHRPAGERVKTDLKDAVLLARLLRMGELTAVAVPTADHEAARDLLRAREDARSDLMRARHRCSKLLLRHGILYCGGRAWSGDHDRWLRARHFDSPVLQATFESDYEAVLDVTARRDRLDRAIAALAADSEFTPLVRRLGCLRGIGDLTGLGLAVEIGDWTRFTGATIGSFVGLVPTEHSSGDHRAQGSITKAGNTHVRRLLVEAAWHHRSRYAAGLGLRRRWELSTPAARARGHAGNIRLHRQWVKFIDRKKKNTIADVAIARELAGWCWSLATLDEPPDLSNLPKSPTLRE